MTYLKINFSILPRVSSISSFWDCCGQLGTGVCSLASLVLDLNLQGFNHLTSCGHASSISVCTQSQLPMPVTCMTQQLFGAPCSHRVVVLYSSLSTLAEMGTLITKWTTDLGCTPFRNRFLLVLISAQVDTGLQSEDLFWGFVWHLWSTDKVPLYWIKHSRPHASLSHWA